MKKYIKEYGRLLLFVRPYTLLIFLAFVCMLFSSLFNGVSLGMIVPVTDRVLTNKEIKIPRDIPAFVQDGIDKLNAMEPMMVLKVVAVTIIFLYLLKGIFFFLQSYLMNRIAYSCVRDVRSRLYRKFQELSLDFYSRKRAGELIARVTNDVAYITTAISYSFTDFIYQSLYAVVLIFVIFYIYWKLALISFVIFPLLIFPVVQLGKRIKKFSGETQKRMADLNSHLTETLQGANVVKLYNRQEHECERFREINQQHYRNMMKMIKRDIVISPLSEFVGTLIGIGILLIASKDVIAGKISFGVFGLFLGSLMSLMRPLKKLSGVHAINQRALAASVRVYEILDERPSIQDKPDAVDVSVFNDTIVFEGVSFTYPGGESEVLKNIDLSVRKNEVVAIVGHSGVGKTTLVNLIPRLYDPQKGRILLDGVDIADIKVRSLRSLISVVSQEMIIFNDTARNNIAYGKEGAALAEIEEAAKKAHAYEFIKKMPQGFGSIVGDRGFKLSGGEKQRISIARAFLKNAPILILDEATSQLDTESEGLIRDALEQLIAGKTVFVIAHRLSTAQRATRIIVMGEGRIVEQGTHQDLLAHAGIYKRLYELQFNA